MEKLEKIQTEKLEVTAGAYELSLKMAEEIGKVKMAQSMASGLSLAVIRWFAAMKESGAYKNAVLVNPQGKTFIPETFEDLCDGMGFSKPYIYEQLQNFAELGPRYLEEAQGMGLTVRDLRKLRKALRDAPEDKREEIMASLRYSKDDNEDLKTALDVVCAQYAKAKEENKKLADQAARLEEDKAALKADYAAQARVLATRNDQYAELQDKYEKATSARPEDQEIARAEFLAKARESVDAACSEAVIAMSKMGQEAESCLLDERADAALKLYITDRVNIAIRDIGFLLRGRELDIDLEAEFRAPEFLEYNEKDGGE